MKNECLTTIANRYSCRDFTGDPLDDEIMDVILTAGLQAPSAVNRQPWQIIWVKNRELIRDMEAAAIDYFRQNEDQSTYDRILERDNGIFYNAATVLVLTIHKAHRDAALLDAGILTQNMVLAAESLGYGSLICGMARAAFLHAEHGETLKKKVEFPANHEFAVAILLGKPETKRRPHNIERNKITIV